MSEDVRSQVFRSVIEYGREAMKAAILINGGASIALLAFLGNIWIKQSGHGIIDSLSLAIISFSVGIVVAGLSWVISYMWYFDFNNTLEKFQFLDQLRKDADKVNELQQQHSYMIYVDYEGEWEKHNKELEKYRNDSKKKYRFTISLVSLSFVSFAVGMGISVRAIVVHFSSF